MLLYFTSQEATNVLVPIIYYVCQIADVLAAGGAVEDIELVEEAV